MFPHQPSEVLDKYSAKKMCSVRYL